MTAVKQFLVVDDDRQNNFLTEMALKKSFEAAEVTVFMVPELALEHIETQFQNTEDKKITIILDINMPTMSGWEFVEKFNALDKSLKKLFDIYMLSSSIDAADISRAKGNPLILDFIEKPLNKMIVKKIFGESI